MNRFIKISSFVLCCLAFAGCSGDDQLASGYGGPDVALSDAGVTDSTSKAEVEYCNVASQCKYGDSCTPASCKSGQCEYHELPTNAQCDDANACTVGDRCLNGTCQSGTLILCDDNNPCTDDSCHPTKGCLNVSNSIACDDGDKCTGEDKCVGGKCKAGSNTCECKSNADCGVFEDGNKCNGTLLCVNAKCVVDQTSIVACDPTKNTACSEQVCVSALGKCVSKMLNQGTKCSDDNPCTTGDFCSGGACKGDGQKDCDDNNPCTDDTCDPLKGCEYKANTASCDDGSSITSNDVCKVGKCEGTFNSQACEADVQCVDNNVCTKDVCFKNHCLHVLPDVNAGTSQNCTDGNPCTMGDVCVGASCKGTTKNCDDNNPCTTDSCDPGFGCKYTDNKASCNDGNVLTVNDTCNVGKCSGTIDSKKCTTNSACDDDNVCTKDECNASHQCTHKAIDSSNAAKPTTCSDGDPCTGLDQCAKGVCKGSPVTCDDGNACTDDKCDPTKGCIATNNSAACNDGATCTVGDKCVSGKCESGLDVCECKFDKDCLAKEDGDVCNGSLFCINNKCVVDPSTVVSCDPNLNTACSLQVCEKASGKCFSKAEVNGKSCDDNNTCTLSDKCGGGKCLGSEAICNDGNACTTDSCDPVKGCVFLTNTASCDDGDTCTSDDTCKAGKCQSGKYTCECKGNGDCDDNNLCTNDSCDAGKCKYANNTQLCDDGALCTSGDKCSGGKCMPGVYVCQCKADVDCDDGNSCTKNTCSATGKCEVAQLTVVCTDNNLCTSGDKCDGKGNCTGTKVSCDDGNVCTNDSCDSVKGCVTLPNTVTCTDSNACSIGDKCNGKGACEGKVKDCDDGNVCTNDSCDVDKGCTYKNNSALCVDGNVCTSGDQCNAGKCVSGKNMCQCTKDADCASSENKDLCDGSLYCDLVTNKCQVKASTVVVCSNSGDTACAKNSCNPTSGKCDMIAQVGSGSCSDGNVCTASDHCFQGKCEGVTVVCNDNNPCTTDSCDPKKGCSFVNNTATCDDGNSCTADDTCSNGTCQSSKYTCQCKDSSTCNDNNECTTDTCSANGKCSFINLYVSCTDGDACTTSDTCVSGKCVGASVSCDDGNPCTIDACDKAKGCTNTTDDKLTCSDNNPDTLDTCKSGVCVGTKVTAKCITDAHCQDGKFCNGEERCLNGTCETSVKAPNCDDGVSCTIDSCVESLSGCVNKSDNTKCSSGTLCFQSDKSNGAVGGCYECLPHNSSYEAPTCNDGNICTKDLCATSGKCQTTNLEDTNEVNTCSDGNACTQSDTCKSGSCISGTQISCDDLDASTADSCVSVGTTPTCKHVKLPPTSGSGSSASAKTCYRWSISSTQNFTYVRIQGCVGLMNSSTSVKCEQSAWKSQATTTGANPSVEWCAFVDKGDAMALSVDFSPCVKMADGSCASWSVAGDGKIPVNTFQTVGKFEASFDGGQTYVGLPSDATQATDSSKNFFLADNAQGGMTTFVKAK